MFMLIDVLFGAFMVGAFCGFLPLGVGIIRGRADLGWAGFAVSVFGGLLLGIVLAGLLALVATIGIAIADPGSSKG